MKKYDDYLKLGGYPHAVDNSSVSIENNVGPQEKECLPAAKPDIEGVNQVTADIVIISTKVIKTP